MVSTFSSKLALRAMAEGGAVKRRGVCLTRSLMSSETHAVNPKTQCSSKSCENHDILSQFCLKGSFAWALEPT
jgi:hypothetical protein